MASTEQIIDLASDVVYSASVLVDALLQWRTRPRRLIVLINQRGPSSMPTQIPDDQPFTIHVVALDKFGEAATDANPFVITSSNPTLCAISPDDANHPGDSSYAIGTPQAGEGQFVVNATDGNLKGVSDELDITPGAPAILEVAINAAP